MKCRIIYGIIFCFMFTTIIEGLNVHTVYAAETVSDINIISETDILPECAQEWARRRGATKEFINLVPLYYKYSKEHANVNPAIAYAQSALETGYGKFGSMLGADSHNPCGMKMTQGGGDYDPTIHMKFKSWDDGIKAHLDHLALYAGADGYPLSVNSTLDPRHFKELFGKCKTVKSLGGCYAPSPEYGDKVLELYNSMVQVDKEYRSTVIKNLPAVASIDSIDTSNMLDKKTIKVVGFAISGPGVSSIDLYIGDKLKATFNGNIPRQDVKSSYSLYNTDKAGFDLDIDVSDLEAKEQTIKLQIKSNNGSIYEISKNFLLEKKPPLTDEQLKKIENTVAIVLDDNLYNDYVKYNINNALNSKKNILVEMVKNIKNDMENKGYNPVIVKSSIQNSASLENNINTFKSRAEIEINSSWIVEKDISDYKKDNNQIYFYIRQMQDNSQDILDKYSEVSDKVINNFVCDDNNLNLGRSNTFYVINSSITGVKINYYIQKKNTFNDTQNDIGQDQILDNANEYQLK